jgi:hypothetical protein
MDVHQILKWSTVLSGVLILVLIATVIGSIIVRIHADVETWADTNGCEYVIAPKGGVTPRLDANGQQICTGRAGEDEMLEGEER